MAEIDDVLAEILQLRGAEYICLVDRTDGRIIGEAGSDYSVALPGAVVKLERMAFEVVGSRPGDEIEDLVISSSHEYHLVRCVDSDDTPPLLLYLRLRRRSANLAVARRELARTGLRYRLVDLLRGRGGPDIGDGVTMTQETGAPVRLSRSTPPGPLESVPVPGPRYQPDPDGADRAAPALLPLPRRTPASPQPEWAARVPAPDKPAEVPTVMQQSWASDLGTMGRLLHALQRWS